ncbi:hypothetical protein [Clostridium guangxiense]|uniref:hypothetical protein n=1 Tax=Clostridium guangxiense TaxID=1662055 RepID=UPI001E4471F0|nr:hypothetical protein [Clostridium guangxiense]MCD2345802.1 hypothetical protein [Clostridium guangxiense]
MFVWNVSDNKKTKQLEITHKESIEELQECIEAADILKLPFTIIKRNLGSNENEVYFYYFYLDLRNDGHGLSE